MARQFNIAVEFDRNSGGSTVGLKVDSTLYDNACSYIEAAQTKIKQCQTALNNIVASNPNVKNASHYSKLNNSISNFATKIRRLKTKVESVKSSLNRLDKDFASESANLARERAEAAAKNVQELSKQDFNQMGEIEQQKYLEAVQNYDVCLLEMLEQYEAAGMLTEELKKQLEYQKIVVKQYEINENLASITDVFSDEYKKAFEDYANIQRELIKHNPMLTKEQKQAMLASFEEQYNNHLKALADAKLLKEKEEQLIKELEELYKQKDENSDIWKAGKEEELQIAIINKKIEIANVNPNSQYRPTEDELEYLNMNGFEKYMHNRAAFEMSVFTGVLSVAETIVDGTVMLAGGVGMLCGADTQWAEDFVSMSISGEIYDDLVGLTGVNTICAYSGVHTAGNFVGSVAGYVGLCFIPGGPVVSTIVTTTTGALSAMGSAGERALNSGSTFGEAFGVSLVAGAAGAASGFGVGQLGKLAATSTSLLQVGGYTLAGAGVSMLEPVVNTVTEYYVYADEMVDENGNPIYDNGWDYYLESGGALNTAIAAVSGGVGTGAKSFKAYNNYQQLINSDSFKYYEWQVQNQVIDEMKGKLAKATGLNKTEITLSAAEIEEATNLAKQKVLKNAAIVNKISELGGLKPGVTPEYAITFLTTGNPEEILTDSFLNSYKAKWSPNENGEVEVVSLKPGGAYDWFVDQNGSIGRADGEFTMPKKEAEKLINECTKNGVLDTSLLEQKLALPAGTYADGVVQVTQKVKLEDVQLPHAQLGGSWFGEWVLGGATGGGITEGVVEHIQRGPDGYYYRSNGTRIEVEITDFRK